MMPSAPPPPTGHTGPRGGDVPLHRPIRPSEWRGRPVYVFNLPDIGDGYLLVSSWRVLRGDDNALLAVTTPHGEFEAYWAHDGFLLNANDRTVYAMPTGAACQPSVPGWDHRNGPKPKDWKPGDG